MSEPLRPSGRLPTRSGAWFERDVGGALFGRAIRWATLPPAKTGTRYAVESRLENDVCHIEVTPIGVEGEDAERRRLDGVVIAPDLRVRSVKFAFAEKDQYHGAFRPGAVGSYLLVLYAGGERVMVQTINVLQKDSAGHSQRR